MLTDSLVVPVLPRAPHKMVTPQRFYRDANYDLQVVRRRLPRASARAAA